MIRNASNSYMTRPNSDDPINSLRRQGQVIVFRLRSHHIFLNAHLNRIKPEHPPQCTLCNHPSETVKHFLFDCPPLQDLRKIYLPPNPDLDNTLYSNSTQLRQTCNYYTTPWHSAEGPRLRWLLDRQSKVECTCIKKISSKSCRFLDIIVYVVLN